MTIFRFKRPKKTTAQASIVKVRRELWLENFGDCDLEVMLEPWCTIVHVPPRQFAKLVATFEDERDEFHVEYHTDSYLGIYCPPNTEISVIEDRWKTE